MVCGRLPFGDDNQIRKMTTRELHFTRAISHGEWHSLVTMDMYVMYFVLNRCCSN